MHLLLLLDWNDLLQRLLEVDQMSIHGFLVIDELLDVSLKYFNVSVLVVLPNKQWCQNVKTAWIH